MWSTPPRARAVGQRRPADRVRHRGAMDVFRPAHLPPSRFYTARAVRRPGDAAVLALGSARRLCPAFHNRRRVPRWAWRGRSGNHPDRLPPPRHGHERVRLVEKITRARIRDNTKVDLRSVFGPRCASTPRTRRTLFNIGVGPSPKVTPTWPDRRTRNHRPQLLRRSVEPPTDRRDGHPAAPADHSFWWPGRLDASRR